MVKSEHWESVYSAKSETQLSWHQPRPERSFALITTHAPERTASVLDVGGGASSLPDHLLDAGYDDVSVLDVSSAALERSRKRLGARAAGIEWIVADITGWQPPRTWDVWHDRAAFHFLTETAAQDAYIAALTAATRKGSIVIMAAFALDGPERCSGLPVQRYNAATLAARLGDRFVLEAEQSERHITPWGAAQDFAYAVFKRQP